MGSKLTAGADDALSRDTATLQARLPWLDAGTASLLSALAYDLWVTHPEVVALVIFGSVARHQERPLRHRRPSDVDLLALVAPAAAGDTTPGRPTLAQRLALHHTVGEREYHHPAPALAIQLIPAASDLADWDDTFVANVVRDGVLLWARQTLPPTLATLATRGAVFAHDAAGRKQPASLS